MLPLKLLMATFFLSMVVTNDISIVIIVPLTLSLDIRHKDILVILEALTANAGSALTPFGNPQNLFIYWFYAIPPWKFIGAIAPFSLLFFVVLLSASFLFPAQHILRGDNFPRYSPKSYIYLFLFCIVVLAVFRLLPLETGIAVPVFALLFDREDLKVDYALLASFFFFFGLAENIKAALASQIIHSEHIFLFSAFVSQIISNVPAALLFAKFTTHWNALLWGVNAGGFGSLFGSLANLIAYRYYLHYEPTADPVRFALKFLLFGYAAFFLSIGFYFIIH